MSAALLLLMELLLLLLLLMSSALLSPKSLYGLQRGLWRTAWCCTTAAAAESGLLPCWHLPLLLSVCC
jgi:hypothetical protein